MNSDVVVRFTNVTKIYKLYKSDRERFKGLFSKKIKYKTNRAVNDLSFEVHRGESVALFGRNGAGKSTILKMITGVAFPTEGEVEVNGKVSALLELGAGFDLESTGKENIYFKCSLMGMTKSEIAEIEPAIVEFADIGDYMDQPLRSYSSGMKARLGFAINVNAQPDILIVDEALSVGDKNFQKKCRDKVDEIMKDEDVTLLFVTHSLATAQAFSKRGIVREMVKKLFDGEIDDAIEFYDERDAFLKEERLKKLARQEEEARLKELAAQEKKN